MQEEDYPGTHLPPSESAYRVRVAGSDRISNKSLACKTGGSTSDVDKGMFSGEMGYLSSISFL